MVKSIFKEIVIILLLILAVILLLGILFYNYMPSSKIIPAKVEEYAMDQQTKAELEKELSNSKTEEIVKTYMLDATDIAVYEKTKEYNKGKQNPFSDYSSGNSGGESSSGESSSSGNSNNNSGTNNSSSSEGNNSNNSDNTNNSNNSNNSGDAGNTGNTNNSSGTYLNTVGK